MRSNEPGTIGQADDDTISGDHSEDFFSDALAGVFDEVQVQHGEPGGTYDYESTRFGRLRLRLTATDDWDDTLKFAHHLWNGELSIARDLDAGTLDVAGLDVLELGAGTGLAGILACLSGAKNVVLSDYPADAILAALRDNVDRLARSQGKSNCHVVGHAWGTSVDPLLAHAPRGAFDVILLADCLWMPEQHDALLRTIAACLAPQGKVICVAGFHSGRAKMAPFFTRALGAAGFVAELLYEENHHGQRRPWDPDRPEEE